MKLSILKSSNGGFYGTVFKNGDVVRQTGVFVEKKEAEEAGLKLLHSLQNKGK